MKKIILPLALLTLTLASCKKDYSCSCIETGVDYYDMDFDGVDEAHPYSYTENFKVKEATKVQAQSACNEATITMQDGLDNYERKCDLSK
ncbi:hypothetical protein [Fluviicola taffensis]|uniref:Lipoprotein n=1 Tax=Fluviicola taffensis (strain DSM 16823 / NCIMB 13979 / RW262) TaxID=755732 RepID=F2IIH6_FLUTR|nr:hypothetical protein [Fluviicola taffensis]AEA44902.1 hypothetical protein Fluta_2923 [Fluviicola taffensis DSM 16823]